MALALIEGIVVAARLADWPTLALGVAGLALVLSLGAFTVALVRRQQTILRAGETLLQLKSQAPNGGVEPPGLDPMTGSDSSTHDSELPSNRHSGDPQDGLTDPGT
jgi:hypothetical protein